MDETKATTKAKATKATTAKTAAKAKATKAKPVTVQGWCDLCRAVARESGRWMPSLAEHVRQCDEAGCGHPEFYVITDDLAQAEAIAHRILRSARRTKIKRGH